MKWNFETEKQQALTPGLYPVQLNQTRLRDAEEPPIFDPCELMDRVGHDRQLLGEIIELFQEDAPLRAVELETALTRLDSVAFERAAHALKGMLMNFAATPAVETAYALETMGHSHRWMNADVLVTKLEAQIAELNQALNLFEWRHAS
jgi:HPt (histidine-containing phosphotransfer) domain-containing protein